MKHLLLCCTLLCGLQVQAQSIVAGQTTGVAYTDIVPDRTAAATWPNGTPINSTITSSDSLDLDADGRYDLLWTTLIRVWSMSGRGGRDNNALLRPLHANVEVAVVQGPGLIAGFSSSNPINSTLPANTIWLNQASWQPNVYALLRMGSNPAGNFFYSYWTLGQDNYIGIRLRSNSAAPWRYGWVKAQVDASTATNTMTTTVQEYALEESVLNTTAGALDRTWQVYPNPTKDYLELRPQTPITGKARLLDAQGRVVRTLTVQGAASQRLDLSALPAGLYLLQLPTAQGVVITRVIHQ